MIERVLALDLPLVEHASSQNLLYPHQAEMVDAWEGNTCLLLASKTGSGKTAAAMLPVLHRREYAIAVYPTNELLRDQVRSVEQLAAREGIRAIVDQPDGQADRGKADHLLVPLDGPLLDRWQRARTRSRPEALRRLLIRERPRIIFTNPDILFNILSAQYHLDALAPLDVYETLIFDEFHLYQGVELAHALMMVHLSRALGFFKRVVLLTATPDPGVQRLLDRTLRPIRMPNGNLLRPVSTRTAVHDVHVSAVLARQDSVNQIAEQIVLLRPEILRLRQENPEDRYIPAVAVVNSVLDAIRLEDEIVAPGRGFDRSEIAVIRGLSNRALRERQGKLIAIGTSAIEVGVDFDCELLFFEALEAASFLQRFGRTGRHRPGRAFMYVPSNAFAALKAAPESIDRSSFERLISTCYPLSNARPWFVSTEYGLLTAASISQRLYETVRQSQHVSEDHVRRFRALLDTAFNAYGDALECPDVLRRVNAKIKAYEKRDPPAHIMDWYRTYLRLNRFRTSMPSIEVHDWREQGRRGEWDLGSYDIDLATLLKRGRNIRYHPNVGFMIDGIGSSRRVHAGESVADWPRGVPLLTSEHPIRLLQDGQDTLVSDYLSQTAHVFAVVPRADVENVLDWRLTCFEAGQNLIAFDGAALLLIECSRRGSPS